MKNRVCTGAQSGAPNDNFLLNTLKTLFRLSRIVLDLLKCILREAKKKNGFCSVILGDFEAFRNYKQGHSTGNFEKKT